MRGSFCFSPPLPEYRRGEAFFATVAALAESLARFGPPGFRLGTPSPGLDGRGSACWPGADRAAADRGADRVAAVAAGAGAEPGRRIGAAAVGPLLPVLTLLFSAEPELRRRPCPALQIMHKQEISLHIQCIIPVLSLADLGRNRYEPYISMLPAFSQLFAKQWFHE